MQELKNLNTHVILNLAEQNENVIVSANRGDQKSRDLMFTFVFNDEIYNIPPGVVAEIRGSRPDGSAILEECIVEGNNVLYTMTPYVLNISGDIRAKIVLRNVETEQILSSVAFTIHIPCDPFDENAIIKTDEFSLLEKLIQRVESAAIKAEEALEKVEDAIWEVEDAIFEMEDLKKGVINATNSANEASKRADEAVGRVDDAIEEIKDVFDSIGGGLEQVNFYSDLPNLGNPRMIYMVLEDENEELNGMYYWSAITSEYTEIKTGAADYSATIDSLIISLTKKDYETLSDEVRNNGLLYDVIDDNEDVVFEPMTREEIDELLRDIFGEVTQNG